MSEHEFWNELGNLYFLSGAYEPAIHAYARSIELDRSFGRPYSNMALAFVHTGKYQDAIELYHRSIELISDAREKAITWNRLGILYRQIKDYQSALVAYEQADKLDSHQDDRREQASRDVKYPLSVPMPSLDLKGILRRQEHAEIEDETLVQNVNEELEDAETQIEIQWFDGDFPAPDPAEEPVIEFLAELDVPLPDVNPGMEEELVRSVSESMQEEGWIPLIFADPIPVSTPFEMSMQPTRGGAEESVTMTSSWQSQAEETVQENVPIETQAEAANDETSSSNQWTNLSEYQINDGLLVHPDEIGTEAGGNESMLENQWVEVDDELPSVEENTEQSGDQAAFENLPVDASLHQVNKKVEEIAQDELPFEVTEGETNSYGAGLELHSTGVTEAETVEYSQVEYPLVELSPAEIDSIHIDIARFKRIVQINPRNAFAYDTLGGLYKALGRFKDAITSYQQAIALDSTKPSYFYQLGLMYAAERREQEALDAFQRVLGMAPEHTLANASLGSLYRKMGLHDIAQKHIDAALKNVYEEENEYNQACLEAICGNTDRALELLQIAIEDNPTYMNWAQHDPDLDVLRHDERYHMLLESYAQSK